MVTAQLAAHLFFNKIRITHFLSYYFFFEKTTKQTPINFFFTFKKEKRKKTKLKRKEFSY